MIFRPNEFIRADFGIPKNPQKRIRDKWVLDKKALPAGRQAWGEIERIKETLALDFLSCMLNLYPPRRGLCLSRAFLLRGSRVFKRGARVQGGGTEDSPDKTATFVPRRLYSFFNFGYNKFTRLEWLVFCLEPQDRCKWDNLQSWKSFS